MAQYRGRISFQGELGAYSHQACVEACPEYEPVAHHSFEEAIAAAALGNADLAMLPVENSTYGRVADIHRLLPGSGLNIIGEHFLRVHINLLAVPGTPLDHVKTATSHPVLLGQCYKYLDRHKILSVAGADTAGSALAISKRNNPQDAALASELAGEIYGLETVARHIEDVSNNTTRFLIMSPQAQQAAHGEKDVLTSFVFRVRNLPAALYKAMGGFATNGVNMVKLESYMVEGSFTATQFYADVVGHPDDTGLRHALDELEYFTEYVKILGVYKAAQKRE